MIEIPDNDLKRRLEAVTPKDPEDPEDQAKASKEHDGILAEAWKSLSGPARDALELFLAGFENSLVNRLTIPDIQDGKRHFIAGGLKVIHEIQAGIKSFLEFDPDAQDYSPAPSFGDPDAGPTGEVSDGVVY